MAAAALAYHEPGILTILIQSSFLLILNIVGLIIDHVFYCGLVGQVLIGMAWGTPGAGILPLSFEETATQLGYLGLIMIVFEGGLATSAKSLGNSLPLSICVALTGIAVPMALSFTLIGISHATKLQAFAAGAALCSTSLGTTFNLLKTTSLTTSRLGTVLTTAAMLDDVVGLVLVQVISNLGSSHASISVATVIRPIFVSLAFATILPVACRFILQPAIPRCFRTLSESYVKYLLDKLGGPLAFNLVFSTMVLVALVTAASYAGTSNLFAAYLAGAIISWTDEVNSKTSISGSQDAFEERNEQIHTPSAASSGAQIARDCPDSVTGPPREHQVSTTQRCSPTREITPPADDAPEAKVIDQEPDTTAPPTTSTIDGHTIQMYNTFYAPAVDRVLKPFFFASIGFSIPISRMFQASVIWRGFVYAALMAIGKLCCGLWLIRFSGPAQTPQTVRPSTVGLSKEDRSQQQKQKWTLLNQTLPRPKSLYPAAVLGCAMVARGEIGFLIAALAATNGIFSGRGSTEADAASSEFVSELYLIVTWAILLCTIVGPLALGFLAKRVKRLQQDRAGEDGHGTKEDPLGIWGVR